MRIGIDTYSYHRLLGEVRGGEVAAAASWRGEPARAAAQARELGCEAVAFQTCFLPGQGSLDPAELRAWAAPAQALLAWGHPEGLAFGSDPAAAADLMAWIEVSAALGGSPLRLVLGGPRLRGLEPFAEQLERTLPPLRRAAARAAALGVELAIENHGDLSSEQLLELIERAGAPGLGACFDTANAARVGEDVLVAAARLAPLTLMVHLKDVEAPRADGDPAVGPYCTPFGSGAIPLAGVLAALAAPIEAGAPVCVELSQVRPGDDELSLVADSVHWLRRHANQVAGTGPRA